MLARNYLKNYPFLVPPNKLKCGIMVLYEPNAHTNSSKGGSHLGHPKPVSDRREACMYRNSGNWVGFTRVRQDSGYSKRGGKS